MDVRSPAAEETAESPGPPWWPGEPLGSLHNNTEAHQLPVEVAHFMRARGRRTLTLCLAGLRGFGQGCEEGLQGPLPARGPSALQSILLFSGIWEGQGLSSWPSGAWRLLTYG